MVDKGEHINLSKKRGRVSKTLTMCNNYNRVCMA